MTKLYGVPGVVYHVNGRIYAARDGDGSLRLVADIGEALVQLTAPRGVGHIDIGRDRYSCVEGKLLAEPQHVAALIRQGCVVEDGVTMIH